MREIASILLLGAFLSPALFALDEPTQSEAFCKDLRQSSAHIRISAGVAERLLVHSEKPIWNHDSMEARGTVVVQFVIGKQGEVLCPEVISGPQLLQQPVLDAIRKYQYKPYILNGQAVVVSTLVSITASNY